MSTSQIHGDEFADIMKAKFRRSADKDRSNTQKVIDIESKFDKILNLPTSIKVSGNGGIALADARKFWAWCGDYRILVGKWTQVDDDKIFGPVIEFIVTGDEHKRLLGDITLQEVTDFHNSIQKWNLPVENYTDDEVREFAQNYKNIHGFAKGKRTLRSLAALNPKISQEINKQTGKISPQRRVQCSVTEIKLKANVKEWEEFEEHYRGIKLGFGLYSTPREFSG